MKILTNVRFYHLAGISQTVQSLMSYAAKQEGDEILGVNLLQTSELNSTQFQKQDKKFSVVTKKVEYPDMEKIIHNCKTIDDLEKNYQPLIKEYCEIIKKEKPDVILINGTYFLPWSLFMAGLNFKIPIFLHYHGILTKEIAHWKKSDRMIYEKMEKTFFNRRVFYIFPSELAKKTVENEIFHRKLGVRSAVLPNPVFFKPTMNDRIKLKNFGRKNIGAVSRWTSVKNPQFFQKIASYDLKRGDLFNFHIVTDLDKKTKIRQDLKPLVSFKPSMGHGKLKNYYSKMDLILSPSHFETYGNVAQESLVHGTPALISKNMGVAEIFRKYGLQKWVIDFRFPSRVHKKMKKAANEKVDFALRCQIADDLSPDKIHEQLFAILRNG